MQKLVSWPMVAAFALAAISVVVTARNIDFPLGTLVDEYAKLHAMAGHANFYHPLLMPELAQVANLVIQAKDPQALVEVGRLCAAFAGGLLVLATFGLARLVLPDLPALAAAAATAVTPLVTVHARLFKEDIFVAPFLILALMALIRLLQAPTNGRALLLGVLLGLAAGAKYVGAVLLPFALAAILLVPSPEVSKWKRRPLLVTAVALVVFRLVEIPGFHRLVRLRRGFQFEWTHMANGHDIALPLTKTFGVFHLSQSLWSGLGPPLLALGLLGLGAPLLATRERRLPLAIIAAFSILWYVIHEAAPLKPYPDFPRYMLPLAALLPILAASLVYELCARFDGRGVTAAAAVLVAAAPALWVSLRTNMPDVDPRDVVPPIVQATGARVAIDRYGRRNARLPILGRTLTPPTALDIDVLITSNFTYDRYDNYAARAEADKLLGGPFYLSLAALPHLDISNGRPSLGYFNPVLRVVALDGRLDRLQQIAEAIHAEAPSLTVDLVEPRPGG